MSERMRNMQKKPRGINKVAERLAAEKPSNVVDPKDVYMAMAIFGIKPQDARRYPKIGIHQHQMSHQIQYSGHRLATQS